MTPAKRFLDVLLALLVAAIVFLPFCMLLIWLILREGWPLFYVSERMHAPGKPFLLWKLRTMRVANVDSGVSGGDKASRITPMGRWLRKYRADEIPQLWNVLKGDMSFVGPRPPLRAYVERFPDLYARVLQSRPGVTGFATLHFRAREEQLLKACTTAEETDHVYVRHCIRQKARLDLVYARRRTLCSDVVLIVQTLRGLFRKP
ncbi:sugar transferase [Pseudorhodobacter sp. MZDSW-24AT]|uniref:sugar transferase n=1 Tax=Pseudorhodobacter sp. MZDSW-24AT TaxID=2052957 RepID=UPI000C1DD42A|nr:sugar transferase [Pseudorhodobacter sp. MZDSW-24AT]PJF10020.1 sugar transferase [Pseudorhodobacter sp. MZDSW-24AT]